MPHDASVIQMVVVVVAATAGIAVQASEKDDQNICNDTCPIAAAPPCVPLLPLPSPKHSRPP